MSRLTIPSFVLKKFCGGISWVSFPVNLSLLLWTVEIHSMLVFSGMLNFHPENYLEDVHRFPDSYVLSQASPKTRQRQHKEKSKLNILSEFLKRRKSQEEPMNEQISQAVSLFIWFPTPRNSNIFWTQRWWCSRWVFSGGDGGFSLFFGDEPFWLPPKKCYVIACFNGLFYQAATVSSHVSMGMRTSKVLAWMLFSWKLRNFSIEKTTLRIS